MRTRLPATCLALALVAGPAHALTPDALVVFGDSLSDTGLVWQTLQATSGTNLPQSPYYMDGRFSNGPVAVEYMAQTLGVPLIDRAWGGATTGTDNILDTQGELAHTGVLDQVGQYIQASGGALDKDALYMLWAGGNDLIFGPDTATATLASQNLMQALDTLYQAGARTFFLPLMPDLSWMPLASQLHRVDAYHQMSLDFNARLSADMDAARLAHADALVLGFDTVSYLAALRALPDSPFTDLSTPCVKGNFERVSGVCDNPQSHFYWDTSHFTTGVHADLGGALGAAVVSAVPEAASATQMAWGLCGLAGLCWRAGRQRTKRRTHTARPA